MQDKKEQKRQFSIKYEIVEFEEELGRLGYKIEDMEEEGTRSTQKECGSRLDEKNTPFSEQSSRANF